MPKTKSKPLEERRIPLQVNFDKPSRDILAKVGERNRSRYTNTVLQQRAEEAAEALMHLNGIGWDGVAIVAACDALNQPAATAAMPLAKPLSRSVPHALRQHSESAIERHSVAGDAWDAMAEQAEDPTTALAVWIVAREYWSGNVDYRTKALASKPI